MNKNDYECEKCGGMFIIIPDTNEIIIHCPQCGNSSKSFKHTYYPIRSDKDYDQS